MRDIRFTTTEVRGLVFAETGQVHYYDTRLPGFGLRVGKSKKTYIAEKRVNGRTRRVSIGSADVFSCDQARRLAQQLLGAMAAGRDPNAEKAQRRAEKLSLGEAFDEFLASRRIADSTRYNYGRLLRVAFGDWLDKSMTTISGEMMLRRFRQVTENHGPAYANHAARALRSIWNFARATYQGERWLSLPA